ncbi:hypothetical protein QT235_03135 [Geobacillus stearothermophilus]|uniref:phage tail fiber protein n=1 Tax=Geobacillus stearothermophilus TaxID=1422 RepID=UPI000EF60F1E|nr:hypothetical protein [Geobacillus stearothermophilus]RLP97309.1 hypothetical protein D9545_14510 [Geobacillus stearothermophilus]WJQ07664.1 hypothetical protein QT235_03135 [Geobacillus stearothermophilus]WJQ11137.1 hypothetical protein QT237_03050 [Geobacillus stearothermophilus]
MSAISNYLENALINAVLRNIPYTSPAAVYLALYTSDPTDANTGTEVTGGSYQRQQITFGAPNNGMVSNSNEILFPVATANWGTVTHIGILDAATGGNLLFYGAVTTPKTISTNDQLKINAGDISITLA